MAILLGRDATITVDGVTVAGVRDATIDTRATTIEVQPFGSRDRVSLSTGNSFSLSMDVIDDTAIPTLLAACAAGTVVTVAVSGYSSYPAIIAGVSDAQPLDGVRAWTVTVERTLAGW